MDKQSYTITKKVAKHGSQAVILIPKVLEDELKPGTIVEINIRVMREAGE